MLNKTSLENQVAIQKLQKKIGDLEKSMQRDKADQWKIISELIEKQEGVGKQ